MDKKQQKQFRTLLYQRYGAVYMEDRHAVEELYDADFDWVMAETKAGWHPTFMRVEWRKRFAAAQNLMIEILGNTVPLDEWNAIAKKFAVCNLDRVRQCLLVGMSPYIAAVYAGTQMNDAMFTATIKMYQWMLPPLKASDLSRIHQPEKKIKFEPTPRVKPEKVDVKHGTGSIISALMKHYNLSPSDLAQDIPVGPSRSAEAYRQFEQAKSDFYANMEARKPMQLLMCKHCYFVNAITCEVCGGCGFNFKEGKKAPSGHISFGSCDKPLRSVRSPYLSDILNDLNANSDKMREVIMFKPVCSGPTSAVIPGMRAYIIDDVDILETKEAMLKSIDIIKSGIRDFQKVAIDFSNCFPNLKNKNNVNNTNQAPMSKEEKRKRIQELENALAAVKKHREEVAQVENAIKNSNGTKLEVRIDAVNNGDRVLAKFYMNAPDFMKPETMVKVYKMELDEEEAKYTAELNKLIA